MTKKKEKEQRMTLLGVCFQRRVPTGSRSSRGTRRQQQQQQQQQQQLQQQQLQQQLRSSYQMPKLRSNACTSNW
jgi:transcription initiation factor TFIID subunit TAF12